MKSMLGLASMRILRWTGILSGKQLHIFTDASAGAYAAAVYLKGTGPSEE